MNEGVDQKHILHCIKWLGATNVHLNTPLDKEHLKIPVVVLRTKSH